MPDEVERRIQAALAARPGVGFGRAEADQLVKERIRRLETLIRQTQTGTVHRAVGEFFAYRSTTVSYTTGSVVVFNAESWDPHGWYDVATGRYTPQRAGKYFLAAAVELSAALTADLWLQMQVFKNGAQWDTGPTFFQRGTKSLIGTVVTEVDANGTTDFFDVRITHNKGSAQGINFGVPYAANFKGHLIGV